VVKARIYIISLLDFIRSFYFIDGRYSRRQHLTVGGKWPFSVWGGEVVRPLRPTPWLRAWTKFLRQRSFVTECFLYNCRQKMLFREHCVRGRPHDFFATSPTSPFSLHSYPICVPLHFLASSLSLPLPTPSLSFPFFLFSLHSIPFLFPSPLSTQSFPSPPRNGPVKSS